MYRNIEALRQLMARLDPKQEEITNDQLIWFVCVQEAHTISDMTLRETACLFLNGIKPVTIEYVQEWLDIFYCDEEEVINTEESFSTVLMHQLVYSFYGEHDKARECRDKIAEM